MSISPARLEANRKNALKSTGPKTEAGKSASRMNAMKHGLAGAEDLIADKDDGELVLKRAEAFARELHAPGAMGQLLAHRAALLSVRMERAAVQELAAVAAAINIARDAFDQELIDERLEWLKALDGDDLDKIAIALLDLEISPEGLDLLLDAWADLAKKIRAGDDSAEARASLWFGQVEPQPKDLLLGAIFDEIDRLRRLLATTGDSLRANLDAARDEAGIIASFDPSPEACRARRYEAAAERGFYKALRAIRELRREVETTNPMATPSPAMFAPPPPLPQPAAARPAEPPRPAAPSAPLGSFRAQGPIIAAHQPEPAPILIQDEIPPQTPRKPRPDLRKLGKNRR